MHTLNTLIPLATVMRPAIGPSCLKQPRFLHRLSCVCPRTFVPRRIVTTSTSHSAPIDVPKVMISPGSVHHNSLATFHEYVARKKVNRSTSVYNGTLYEYTTAVALLRLGFSLVRTGRRADAGIDLAGHWVLPPLREPLPVIVQCKAMIQVCSPSHVRELEGSFASTPANWRSKDVLGLLITCQNATSGVLHAMSVSRFPMGYVKITRTGVVEQFVWNRVASERGLEGVGVTIRHTPLVLLPDPEEWAPAKDPSDMDAAARMHRRAIAAKFRNSGTLKDIQLTWLGSPINAELEVVDPTTRMISEPLKPPAPTKKVKRKAGRPRGSKDYKERAPRGTFVLNGQSLKDLSLEEQDELRAKYIPFGRSKGTNAMDTAMSRRRRNSVPKKLTPEPKNKGGDQVQGERRAGRPKGSRDSKPRKRRSNLLDQDGD